MDLSSRSSGKGAKDMSRQPFEFILISITYDKRFRRISVFTPKPEPGELERGGVEDC